MNKLIEKIKSWFGKNRKPESEVISSEQKISISGKSYIDMASPNLWAGRIVDAGNVIFEVIRAHPMKHLLGTIPHHFEIKILKINDKHWTTYLNVGNAYVIYKHDADERLEKDMLIYEISPKHMKRNTSQALFSWERDVGWCCELDF